MKFTIKAYNPTEVLKREIEELAVDNDIDFVEIESEHDGGVIVESECGMVELIDGNLSLAMDSVRCNYDGEE